VLALLAEGCGLPWWYRGSSGSPKMLINGQAVLASGDSLSRRDPKDGKGGVNLISPS